MVRLFDAGMRRDRKADVTDRVWTVANVVTFVRLLGLPLFVYLMAIPEAYGMAFLTLVVVGTTDWVDGYIARRFNQITKLGRMLDPLIDRFLLATAGLTMVVLGIIPPWVVALIIGRDVMLVGAAWMLFRGNPDIPVSYLGKFATACLLVGVPGFLLGHMEWSGSAFWGTVGWVFTVVGIAAYYAAGVEYAKKARARLLAQRGDAAPQTTQTGAGE